MTTPSSPLGSRDDSTQAKEDLAVTVAALEGGIDTLNPDTGQRIVAMWRNVLRRSDWPSAHHIASLLDELHDRLAADEIDGSAVGDLMVQLAEATRVAAADAVDVRSDPMLDKLAVLLERAGRALGGSVVEAHSPRVDDEDR